MDTEIFSAPERLPQLFVFVLLAALMTFIVSHYFLKPKNFPPGPYGLPVVGYLPFLGKEPYIVLQKLQMKYGGIYSLLLGRKPVVVIADYEVMKEAYLKSSLLGRPSITAFDCLIKLKGIGVSSGETWMEDRKFFMTNLRRFGNKLDDAIEKEIPYLVKRISDAKGKPLSFKDLVSSSVLSLITDFAMDIRLSFDDPRKVLLDSVATRGFKYVGMVSYALYIRWLQPMVFLEMYITRFWRQLIKLSVESAKIFEKLADKFDKENIKNFSDAFFLEIENQRNDPRTTYTVEGYVGNILTLLGAGFDTVALSLSWTMLALASYPAIQKRVHSEIDLVFGKDGKPNWEDRVRMPITQAVIMEIQRWRTILPLSGLRRTLSDTTLQGYNLPKDTIILLNLWGLHNDPNYWKNPEEFQPERFISSDGSSLIKPKSYVPFSYGKRSCPAEGIAYKEVFLYMTTILQKFTVTLPGDQKVDLEGISNGGLTLVPKPHYLSFLPRVIVN